MQCEGDCEANDFHDPTNPASETARIKTRPRRASAGLGGAFHG